MPDDLVIQAPRQGISQSPHTGFADVRNLDVTSVPGVAQLNTIAVKVSGSTVTAQVTWFARNPTTTGEIYAADSSGNIYKSSDSGATWAVLQGAQALSTNGLAIWKDYLFNAHPSTIDVYGPLSGATFTVTIASPAVFTKTGHGLVANDTIIFSTSGALPTGLTAGTRYYVIAAGLTADNFEVSTSQGGSAVNTSGSQSGTHTYTAWDLNWPTGQPIDTDSLWHPMLVSKNDNKLYGGAGRYVFSVEELSTFAPGTSGTFTFTPQALNLPSPYRIKCIEELNGYLMLGTWQGSNVYDIRIGDIFPWDRSSPSFGQPIETEDYGVHAMLNDGNALIVLAGIEGTVYRCDGANAYPIAKLPYYLDSDEVLEWFPGSICKYKEKVFFGTGSSSFNGGHGIYSLQQTAKGNIISLEHLNSQLTDGTSVVVRNSALLPVTRNTLLIGWRSDTNFGIDLTSASSFAYTTDYSGYFDSPLYVVGSNRNPREFTELDLQLAKKLATGQGIRVKYRTNLTDSFSTIGTYNFTNLGAITSYSTPPGIPKCQLLQIRVEILGTSTTTPQFKSLTLR